LPLPWFRRRAAEEGQPRDIAPAPVHVEVIPDPAPEAETEAVSTDPNAPAKPKRRRGSRGGRGRKKPAGAAGAATDESTEAADTDEATPAAAEKKPSSRSKTPREKPERKEPAKRERTRKEPTNRRRTAPRRAPLPKAKRELLVAVDAGEKRVAVLEDDRVAEVYLERPERSSIAGNIYKGVVDNVLPGMEAAFVEIGLEKNGFLYVDEIVGPELEGRKGARKIQDLISKGQEILVQAVKDPMKTKGARLTTEISLPGRFVVYQPLGEGTGVSRRLEDEERSRLKAIIKEVAPKEGGLIVRTAAEGASAEDIERDIDFLERLWKTIEAGAKTAKPETLVYQEAELPLRVVRDLFTGDFEKAYVDHDRTYKRIVGYLKKTSPHMVERVIRYKEKEPLMDAFGVDAEIKSTLNRRVDLPSGGYLIFDYAEAFTVIDVNTGRFVGSRSKTSGARLEDTITKNNLEAVKEVVRQLRLRDIGGIIVIDFIDMANPKNRQAVEEALRNELEKDRTKTYVVEISPLGLVEMTRQNVTDGPREVMTKKCPTCSGDGIVVSEYTAAVEIERKLRQLVTPGSRVQAFKVAVNARVASLLIGPGAARLLEIEEMTRRSFFLIGDEDVHLDHFLVVEQGSLEKLKPEAPVEEGKTISIKLGEVDKHDGTAGVAHLDSYSVCVSGAAKLVGKTVKVKVERVLEGVAYATLVTPLSTEQEPITAEAEAEKPTRAKRPRKADGDQPLALVDGAEDDVEAEVEVEEPEEDEEPTAEEIEAAGGDVAAAAAAKKRTRRGSRGGRRRKKKPAVEGEATGTTGETDEAAPADAIAAEPAEDAAPAVFDEPTGGDLDELPAPRIHVPGPDLGREDEEETDGERAETPAGETPKKKTRRGSRGGRNRKKKPAVASENGSEPTGDAELETDEDAVEPETLAVSELETEALAEAVEPEAEPEAVEPEPEPEAVEPTPEEPSQNGDTEKSDDEWGYVPMSEWGDDFRR
jgi:ribonuclease G